LNRYELSFGIVLVAILVGVAGYFTWRQWLTLKQLNADSPGSPEDHQFLRSQVRRRLICCGLMAFFALLLIGTLFLEGEYQRITSGIDQTGTDNRISDLDPDDRMFLRLFTLYWIFALLVFLAFVILAGLDLRATLREGFRKHRQLREDHKAQLQEQLRQYRKENNGHF
jgi:uncharacterized membrane protein YjgN (DUF898 family)